MEYFLLGLFVGAGIGGSFSYLLVRMKFQAARNDGVEVARLTERLGSQEARNAQLETSVNDGLHKIDELRSKNTSLQTGEAALVQRLEAEQKSAGEKLALLTEAKQVLENAFKVAAAQSLQTNNESFLKLATTKLETYQEQAKGELQKRETAIAELVNPVKESLGKVDLKLQEIEKSRIEAYSGLKEQVVSIADANKELRTETAALVQALRRPAVRGRWGEVQLKRVVELAGMLDHCDFYEQASIEGEDGRFRPDLLVRLAGKRTIVVDSKVPLEAFLRSIECTDENDRCSCMKSHAAQVKDHIKKLSAKKYFEQFDDAPEFVVLFLPGEVFFSAALEHDPQLIEFGAEQNVIVATPTTLIALLRAVAFGWRQGILEQNTKEIADLGRELYQRICIMGEHFERVGKNLRLATEAYNKTVGTLESRVLVTARKFQDLRAAESGMEITELSPVDEVTRELQSTELRRIIGSDAATP